MNVFFTGSLYEGKPYVTIDLGVPKVLSCLNRENAHSASRDWFRFQDITNLVSESIPFYMFTGGLIGILTVLFTNASFMGLGVSLTVSLSLLGQLITSLVIDHFGYFNMPVVEFNKKKILGLVIIIAGIYVMTLS